MEQFLTTTSKPQGFQEMKIWTSLVSLSDALRCLPAALAANSLLRASSRAFAASDFTTGSRLWPVLDLPAPVYIYIHMHIYFLLRYLTFYYNFIFVVSLSQPSKRQAIHLSAINLQLNIKNLTSFIKYVKPMAPI